MQTAEELQRVRAETQALLETPTRPRPGTPCGIRYRVRFRLYRSQSLQANTSTHFAVFFENTRKDRNNCTLLRRSKLNVTNISR